MLTPVIEEWHEWAGARGGITPLLEEVWILDFAEVLRGLDI